MKTVKIGAHLSGGKDLTKTMEAIGRRKVEAVQFFLGSPKSYTMAEPLHTVDQKFKEFADKKSVAAFAHSPYLINFGSQNPYVRTKSAELLLVNLERGRSLGLQGIVVHSGSATGGATPEEGLDLTRKSLLPVLESLDSNSPPVLLEPMAGQGACLASTVASLATYLSALGDHPKLAVCLDTAHLLAAGVPLDEEGGTTSMLEEFDRTIGLERLLLVHANDSKAARGSHLDRHENLGRGTLGAHCWSELFQHPKMKAPLVLETPGGGLGKDLALLRATRAATAEGH